MMNTSFAYNATEVHFGSFGGRPTSSGTAGDHPDLRGSDQPRSSRGRPVRLPHVGQRHRQRLRQRQVAVQAERPLSSCRCDQRVGVLQRAPGLPAGDLGADSPCPSRSRRGCRGNGSSDRRAAIRSARPRLPNYQNLDLHVERPISDAVPAVHPVAGRVQRRQLEHGPGDPRHARTRPTPTRSRRSSRRAWCGSAFA